MTPDEDFDAYLAAALAEPDLADAGFTSSFMSRLRRERRRRQIVIGAATVAGMGSTLASWFSEQPWLPMQGLSTTSLAATLVLAGLCGIVWVVTEIQRMS
jgi:hypothetical protein